MAKLKKKVINTWDGGIQTSSRDNKQETSYGAQMVKHFDVFTDPKKLIPLPDWTAFTTTAEKVYGIKAIGGLTDTIYGIGSGLSNWYGADWGYRLKIELAATATAGLASFIDLANMPAGFWTNVNTDGSDIRVTEADLVTGRAFELTNFDYSGNTGELWVRGSTLDDGIYVYYGNSDATAIGNGTASQSFLNQPRNSWSGTSMDFAYTFSSDVENRLGYVGDLQEFTSVPTYVDAPFFGKGVQTLSGAISTDTDDEVAITGNDMTASFTINLSRAPSTRTSVYRSTNSDFDIYINTDRTIDFFLQGTSASATKTSTAALTLDTDYLIHCSYNGATYKIYINGVVEEFADINGDFDYDTVNAAIAVNTISSGGNFCTIGQTWGMGNDMTQAEITGHYENFSDNSNFWTIGSEVAKSTIGLQYSGVQVYTKLVSSGDWSEYILAGQPAKNPNYFPLNGFVEVSGDVYFLVSSAQNEGGIVSIAKTSSFDVLDPTHQNLLTIVDSLKTVGLSASPFDGSTYLTGGDTSSAAIDELGDPIVNSMFTAPSHVQSMIPWRTYLAVASNRRNKGSIVLWDLVEASLAVEKIDLGTGNIRIVGNASDVLFGVVDNFVDDAVKSAAKPTVEIRRYVGNGTTTSSVVIEIPANYTDWEDRWERAVSNFSFERNRQTLFFASLPSNATATEFNTGIWSVGLNSDNKLSLNLMFDTSDLDDLPEQMYGFAQQIFYVEKDGGIKQLSTSGTYTKTSSYKTLKMNEGNSEIKKKLMGVEIVTEPLDSGQTVSVYYKQDGDSSRTKILDFSEEGEISREATFLAVGEVNLPHYKEIEFDIESTGGAAAVLEFNYKYEGLSDII